MKNQGVKIIENFTLLNETIEEIKSWQAFLVFMTIFLLIVSVVSFINIAMILSSVIKQEQKTQFVKYLCGETNAQYITSTTIEFVVISTVSYHLSIVLYYILQPFVPSSFYFELSLNVYLLELILTIVLSGLLALVFSYKQTRSNFTKELRG